MNNRTIIVDENDQIIGYKARDTITAKDVYRVSALWVTNAQGDILLAQRAFTKKHHPGMWGPAVAGTVEEGESYRDNIIKEIAEEIGLSNVKPVKNKKWRTTPATGDHNHFTQWYTLTIDKPAKDFVIQKDEVTQVRWFPQAELENELRTHPEQYLKGVKWAMENL